MIIEERHTLPMIKVEAKLPMNGTINIPDVSSFGNAYRGVKVLSSDGVNADCIVTIEQ